MPNVDEHMDDLFRKAANQYPLKTGSGNWDAVQAALSDDDDDAATVVPRPGPIKKYGWLFLFLLLGTALTYYFTRTKPDDIAAGDTITAASSTGKPQDLTAPQQKHTDASSPVTTLSKVENNLPATQSRPDDNDPGLPLATGSPAEVKGSQVSAASNKNIPVRTMASLFAQAGPRLSIQITPGEIMVSENKNPDKTPGNRETLPFGSTAPASPLPVDLSMAAASQEFISPDSLKNDTAIQHSAKQPNTKKQGRFYFGISGGLELNQVKNQSMKKPGLNAGIMAGWQLSPRFALETGITASQKNYYSSGTYFNPKQGMMPAGMKVMSLDGSSTLLEIPVLIKYNFAQKNNSFYGIAGLSANWLMKEFNQYDIMMGSTPMQMKATYRENEVYLPGSLHLGLGFQNRLSDHTVLRIEPYTKIPLKRMGVGAMPVSSFGVQLRLTRQ